MKNWHAFARNGDLPRCRLLLSDQLPSYGKIKEEMRQKMIPGPPKATGTKKPRNEFEAFDRIATRVLNAPKSVVAAKKKVAPKKRAK